MNWQIALTTFSSVFLAELGDKTQLATFTLAAQSGARWAVFMGSAVALVASSLLATLAGSALSRHVPPYYLQRGAAVLFVILGLWLWWRPVTTAG